MIKRLNIFYIIYLLNGMLVDNNLRYILEIMCEIQHRSIEGE